MAAALTVYTALTVIASLKIMFAPFLPFTCEKLHKFLGYETPLFGEQYTETVKNSLGGHTVLRYQPIEGLQWKPSELKPGQKLNQPGPLFKVTHCEIFETVKLLIEASYNFFNHYNANLKDVLSIIGALPS